MTFPRTHFPDSLDFSFSGLKTAALNQLNRLRQVAGKDKAEGQTLGNVAPDAIWTGPVSQADFAASYQQAIVDYLTDHAIAAAQAHGLKRLAVAGGVSANRCLRDTLQHRSQAVGLDFLCPPFEFCTDNAAMIASAGYYAFQNGRRDSLDLNATATLELV